MTAPPAPSRVARTVTAARPVPRASKVGAVTIAAGLLFDLVEHAVVGHEHEVTLGAFPVSEHLAHLVVLIGMVIVLVGVVADGVRTGRARPEGSPSDAVR